MTDTETNTTSQEIKAIKEELDCTKKVLGYMIESLVASIHNSAEKCSHHTQSLDLGVFEILDRIVLYISTGNNLTDIDNNSVRETVYREKPMATHETTSRKPEDSNPSDLASENEKLHEQLKLWKKRASEYTRYILACDDDFAKIYKAKNSMTISKTALAFDVDGIFTREKMENRRRFLEELHQHIGELMA